MDSTNNDEIMEEAGRNLSNSEEEEDHRHHRMYDQEEEDSAIVNRIFRDSMTNERQGNQDVQYDAKTGRVTALCLGTTLAAPFDHHWDLSTQVARLDALESLSLTSCKTLPTELGNLTRLRKLTLIGCKRMESFPENLFQSVHHHNGRSNSLEQLEELRILGIGAMIPPYILSQIASLPRLKVLQFSFHGNSDDEQLFYLQQFLRPNIQFTESLKELNLNRSHITTNGFNMLLSEIVPRYPNLRSLSLCKNQILSFRELMGENVNGRIGNGGERNLNLPVCELQELILSDNPVWSASSSKAELERRYLEHFVKLRAVRLGYLGYRFEKSNLWSPTTQHWLDINKCGRFLVDKGNRRGNNRAETELLRARLSSSTPDTIMDGNQDTDDQNDVPLALWALILERANIVFPKLESITRTDCQMSSSARTSNVLYYLVRNGPAVAGRDFSMRQEI